MKDVDDAADPGLEVRPFYAAEIARRLSAAKRAGHDVVPMHFGQPTLGAPAAAIAAAHRALDTDPQGYWESAALQERIAAHYAADYGVSIGPERILLTAGASAALVAAFATLFRPGQRVALARPGYPAYRNILRALSLTPVEIPCTTATGLRVLPEMLAAVRPTPHGFILASPANPTGAMSTPSEVEGFAKLCRARGIQLISDEIYHGITFGKQATTALQYADSAVVINSFSKLYRMPGWRLGWLVARPAVMPRLRACAINMFLTPPTLAQHAALCAMDEQADIRRAVQVYARNRQALLHGLAGLGIRKVIPPDGAFYLYADVGHITQNSLQFCERAADELGVGITPGIDFDPDQGRQFVRFSFAVLPLEIDKAINRLREWIPRYRDTEAQSA